MADRRALNFAFAHLRILKKSQTTKLWKCDTAVERQKTKSVIEEARNEDLTCSTLELEEEMPRSPSSTTSSSTSTAFTTSMILDKTLETERMMTQLEDKLMSMIAEKLVDYEVKVKCAIEENLVDFEKRKKMTGANFLKIDDVN